MKGILILIAAMLFIISCNNSKVTKDKSFRIIIVDTYAYERIQQKRKILNYSPLENGVDSFEIRLWTSLGHTDLNFVKILKYEDSNWHFTQTRYWFSGDTSFPNRGSKIFLDSGIIEYSKLAVPFAKLADSLNTFDLMVFPTQSQIPGFSDNVAGGLYYNLEVSTKNYYKHFYYHEPEHYNDSSNKKFIGLLNLLSIKPNQ